MLSRKKKNKIEKMLAALYVIAERSINEDDVEKRAINMGKIIEIVGDIAFETGGMLSMASGVPIYVKVIKTMNPLLDIEDWLKD